MLKIYLKLKAKEDTQGGYEKGSILEMENDVFNLRTGIAYIPLDKEWEIISFKVLEHESFNDCKHENCSTYFNIGSEYDIKCNDCGEYLND